MESYNNRIPPWLNLRDENCFLEIYRLLYAPLFHFTDSLFALTEIDPEDVLNDVFMQLWNRKNLKFDTLHELKAYLYTSIKNRFRNDIRNKKKIHAYRDHIGKEFEERAFSQIVESEMYSQLNSMEDILPQECAKVFRFLIEGYEINEIAVMTGKSPSTIYDHRNNAIRIIKKRLSREK